jgi:hypothetical protein
MTIFRRTFLIAAALAALTATPAVAEDATSLEARVGEVFHRSMANWRYDYTKMETTRAGVACIPWDRMDAAYLDEALFEALGFSYSVARDDAAVRIATQGCEQMKAANKLTDCACEVVLIDDRLEVQVPADAAERLR